jgi:hypothetical protein
MSKPVNQSHGYVKEAVRMRECVVLDSCGLGEGPVTNSGGQDNELSGSIKDGEILD